MTKKILITIIIILAIIGIYFMVSTFLTAQKVSLNTGGNIDPASSTLTYNNSRYGFSLDYSRHLTATATFDNSYLASSVWSLTAPQDRPTGEPLIAFRVSGSNDVTSGQLRIGVSEDPEQTVDCLKLPPNAIGKAETVNINGNNFTMFNLSDTAMNHYLQAKSYRLINGNRCYALEAIVMGTNPDVYDPKAIAPFTADEAFNQMDEVIKTFQLK